VKLDQLTFTEFVLVDSGELLEHALTAPTIGRLSEVRATFFKSLRLAIWGRGGQGSVTSPHLNVLAVF